MQDREIIAMYQARDERALDETQKRYGALCHGVAMRILEDHRDSEECVNDTLLRAWNSIPPKEEDTAAEASAETDAATQPEDEHDPGFFYPPVSSDDEYREEISGRYVLSYKVEENGERKAIFTITYRGEGYVYIGPSIGNYVRMYLRDPVTGKTISLCESGEMTMDEVERQVNDGDTVIGRLELPPT